MTLKPRITRVLAAALMSGAVVFSTAANALSVKEAMAVALESNPEIG